MYMHRLDRQADKQLDDGQKDRETNRYHTMDGWTDERLDK